jgi:hypothetical protein
VAAKGLKVAGFSASCREAARLARKGVRGATVGTLLRQEEGCVEIKVNDVEVKEKDS